MEGMAVIDMRNAVLATQVAQDAFKALEEETEYAANIERATLLQSERQAIAEKLQKDGETLSQEEIAEGFALLCVVRALTPELKLSIE